MQPDMQPLTFDAVTDAYLRRLFVQCKGRFQSMANHSGLSVRTVYSKMHALGWERGMTELPPPSPEVAQAVGLVPLWRPESPLDDPDGPDGSLPGKDAP